MRPYASFARRASVAPFGLGSIIVTCGICNQAIVIAVRPSRD